MASEITWEHIRTKLLELGSPDVKDLGEYKLRGIESATRLYQILPQNLKDRDFLLPKPAVTGEFVSETEILRQDNLMLTKKMDDLKNKFSELKMVAGRLVQTMNSATGAEVEELSPAVQHMQKIVRGQDKLFDRLQKVEARNGALLNRVIGLNNSATLGTPSQTNLVQSSSKGDLTKDKDHLNTLIIEELDQYSDEGEAKLANIEQQNSVLYAEKLSLQQHILEISNRFNQYLTDKQLLEKELRTQKENSLETSKRLEQQTLLIKALNEELALTKDQLDEKRKSLADIQKESLNVQRRIFKELTELQTGRKSMTEQLIRLKYEVDLLQKKKQIQ